MTQIRSDQFTITRCQFSKGLIRKNRNRENEGSLGRGLSNWVILFMAGPVLLLMLIIITLIDSCEANSDQSPEDELTTF